MIGRLFFVFAGMISFCTVLFFGYQLIHNQYTLSPESIFNKKDSKVIILNNVQETKLSELTINFPKNETDLIEHLTANSCYSERIYISALRNRILIELKTHWNLILAQKYFKLKKIKTRIKDSHLILENGFIAHFFDNYLLIGKQFIEQENWDKTTWPTWDKLASCSVIDFNSNLQSEDYYFQKSTYTRYVSDYHHTEKIEKINDFDLFASVLPKGLENYHFISKNYALKIGKLTKKDLLYQWCDKGYVTFNIDGNTVIVTDFNPNIDPFDILNDETEEDEIISGSRSKYDGIKLFSNFPTSEKGNFYIKYIEDKVVISENQQAVNEVLALYETGQTLTLSVNAKKNIFENLPSEICERYISDKQKFTTSIASNKLISVYKTQNLIIDKDSKDKLEYETSTISTDLKITQIIGSNESQICFAEGEFFCVKNGKKIWSKTYDGEIIDKPICKDILSNGKQQILITTSKKIYLYDIEGTSYKGFPILLKQSPISHAVFFDSNKGKQLFYVSTKNEVVKYNAQGKKLKSIKLTITPNHITPFVFKENKKNLGVILGKNEGQLLQLNNLRILNNFSRLDEKVVFCTTDITPAFFYPQNGKLVRNDFTGKKSIVGSFSRIDLLRNLVGRTRDYITFITDSKFYICDHFGKIIRTVDLPTSNINDYQILTKEDGSSIVAFLDTIENSIYIFTTKGDKIISQALEGQDLICLSEIAKGILVTTKGNNLIIQYKIEQ